MPSLHQIAPSPGRILSVLMSAACLLGPSPARGAEQGEAAVEIRPGDYISIIGNTLADRMQHDGWLEAYLVSRFPKHDLTIRNLGFSGDELKHRLRSANFGSPDEWLARNRTGVIIAFFGYNESFAGE